MHLSQNFIPEQNIGINASLCKFGLNNHAYKQVLAESDASKMLLSWYSIIWRSSWLIRHYINKLSEIRVDKEPAYAHRSIYLNILLGSRFWDKCTVLHMGYIFTLFFLLLVIFCSGAEFWDHLGSWHTTATSNLKYEWIYSPHVQCTFRSIYLYNLLGSRILR